ncbi:MAG: hypothetical protein JNG83_11210 [Opitutaceae bacterium]|nr:hypothetical protein [Opitutaceae bacterium]
MKNRITLSSPVILFLAVALARDPLLAADPAVTGGGKSIGEVITYRGKETTTPEFYHGGLRHAVGVHRYQTLRANRSQAPEGFGRVGWTYNHAPMLAYWQGRFWLNYVSNLIEEHGAPGRTGFQSSADGRHWLQQDVAFPVVEMPPIIPPPRFNDGKVLPPLPRGTESVMHQRMGFYTAPNGRLLTLGFYSYCLNVRSSPNRGHGMGRVAREVHADGSLGPIYFVRYNREAGWSEANTPFPFFDQSPDEPFVAACRALLADKVVTLQWWEEDRATDGFFALNMPTEAETAAKVYGPVSEENPFYILPKALSWYTRADGNLVGLWKNGLAALSRDGGKSWSRGRYFLPGTGAKIWGQRTEDDRYALVYCHSATDRNRYPLVVLTSDDGQVFDDMLAIHTEVPPMRYRGVNKSVGPQYIRGITPGNGNPPGNALWLTYSVNKEDLWVTSVRVPISGQVSEHVRENFDGRKNESDLELWNLYVPQWAPISIVSDPWNPAGRCLELRDEDPYDYAKAERAIPASQRLRVSFSALQVRAGLNGLEVEAHTARNQRALRLWWFPREIGFDLGSVEKTRTPIELGKWHEIVMEIDCPRGTYDVSVDGQWIHRGLALQESPEAIERLVFRTGPWRMDVRHAIISGEPGAAGVADGDLPGADTKVDAGIYLIDNVVTSPL